MRLAVRVERSVARLSDDAGPVAATGTERLLVDKVELLRRLRLGGGNGRGDGEERVHFWWWSGGAVIAKSEGR